MIFPSTAFPNFKPLRNSKENGLEKNNKKKRKNLSSIFKM